MHSETGKDHTRYGRLKAIGAGLVLVAVGVLRLRVGIQVVTHSLGQPVFSGALPQQESGASSSHSFRTHGSQVQRECEQIAADRIKREDECHRIFRQLRAILLARLHIRTEDVETGRGCHERNTLFSVSTFAVDRGILPAQRRSEGHDSPAIMSSYNRAK